MDDHEGVAETSLATEQRWILDFINNKINDEFYGDVIITFHKGRVLHTEERKKTLPPTRGMSKIKTK